MLQMGIMGEQQNRDLSSEYDPDEEELIKLAECFDHICQSLYKNTLDQAPLLK